MAKANDTPTVYDVPLAIMDVVIAGKTPLITNKILDKDLESMEAKQQGQAKRGKEPRDPDEEWRGHLHHLEDGRYGFPAIAVKKAMVRAAKFTDMAMTDANNAIQVLPEKDGLVPILGPEPTMRRDFVILQGKTGSLTYRPVFKTWEIPLTIQFNRKAVSAEQVLNLLEMAGFSPGIGSWRPECSGTFGMFAIKRGG